MGKNLKIALWVSAGVNAAFLVVIIFMSIWTYAEVNPDRSRYQWDVVMDAGGEYGLILPFETTERIFHYNNGGGYAFKTEFSLDQIMGAFLVCGWNAEKTENGVKVAIDYHDTRAFYCVKEFSSYTYDGYSLRPLNHEDWRVW